MQKLLVKLFQRNPKRFLKVFCWFVIAVLVVLIVASLKFMLF